MSVMNLNPKGPMNMPAMSCPSAFGISFHANRLRIRAEPTMMASSNGNEDSVGKAV